MSYTVKEREYEGMLGAFEETVITENAPFDKAFYEFVDSFHDDVLDSDSDTLHSSTDSLGQPRPQMVVSSREIFREVRKNKRFVHKIEYKDSQGFPGYIETIIEKK